MNTLPLSLFTECSTTLLGHPYPGPFGDRPLTGFASHLGTRTSDESPGRVKEMRRRTGRGVRRVGVIQGVPVQKSLGASGEVGSGTTYGCGV